MNQLRLRNACRVQTGDGEKGQLTSLFASQVVHLEPMKKIAQMLRAHRDLILNYFKAKKQLSCGVVEGLNNKAKVTMRKSYGF